MRDIKTMTSDELRSCIQELRSRRKRGYLLKEKKKSKKDPLSNLPKEILCKILEKLG